MGKKVHERSPRHALVGGESVRIELTVNNNLVYKRTATLTALNLNNNVGRYVTDDEDVITHDRDRSYLDLADTLLKKPKKQTRPNKTPRNNKKNK